MPTPPRGPSMHDVAMLANVSAQTVSRVVRGEATVRPETADKVRLAMSRIGYVPNGAAQALRNGTFRTIGIVGHQFSRTGEAHIIASVTSRLQNLGYNTVLAEAISNDPRELTDALMRLSHSVDGLVVLRLKTALAQEVTLPRRIPVVLCDSRLDSDHTTVGTDHAGGARAAVEHLVGLGHTTVHHLAGPDSSIQARLRTEGWADALRDARAPIPRIVHGDWTPRSGFLAAETLLRAPDLTAVFCGNDEMALGLMRALHERGLRVPQDVSVIGFDDLESEWFWPPLTTVAQDFEANGAELVDALVPYLTGDTRPPPQQVLVPANLVLRSSTSTPRHQSYEGV